MLLCAAALNTAAYAQAPADASHWYGAVSAAWLPEVRAEDSQVTLGTAPLAITTVGQFDMGNGTALSLLLGRQFQDADSAWRLEGEYWAGRLKREEFRAGVLQATLDDEIDVDVLFVNAMYRLTGQERSGLWIGAGIGYADVVMPGAVTPGSCSCLDEAEGDGTAWQVRLEYERALAANTFWSAGIAYLWLPESSTRTTGPSFAEHGKLSGGGLRFALRHRF